MSYLTPTEAPQVWLEVLPPKTNAFSAYSSNFNLCVQAWVQSNRCCEADVNDDNFAENYCSNCQYHTGEYEVEIDDMEVYDRRSDTDVYVSATVYTSSPCPCYDDGLGEVQFPCLEGYDGPGSNDDSQDVSLESMTYKLDRPLDQLDDIDNLIEVIQQQRVLFDDDTTAYITSIEGAANTYGNGSVCWGNAKPILTSLSTVENCYASSKVNDDLTTTYAHNENCADIENTELEDCTMALEIIQIQDHDAVVCAPAAIMPQAFLLLATSGCKINQGVAYVPVKRYPDVAIDDDCVTTVFVTDLLNINIRYMFMQQNNDNANAILLGQVPPDFNLEPCKSIQQQSLELAVPANK